MPIANKETYLQDLALALDGFLPKRPCHIVCHGHSVPAGFTIDPRIETFSAYPHLWHRQLAVRFPFAVLNVIVTAVGGENAITGAQRFARDVLAFNPALVTIDYGLNDRYQPADKVEAAWRGMIESSLKQNVKVILLTPSVDLSPGAVPVEPRAEMSKKLAAEYGIGLVDSLAVFYAYREQEGTMTDLMSVAHHPGRAGHQLIARELMRWVPVLTSRYCRG